MKNFIFISPNFPENYKNFCKELKKNGFRVLGIGDCPYANLSPVLVNSLTEYYKVSDLKNYDEVYRAVAYFIYKYGKPDFLESNNEYWLELDARLRTEFNISSGFSLKDMKKVKYKSEMKKYYKKAGIKTADFCFVRSLSGCKKFIAKHGYPVIVKPDNGVGANATYRISDYDELLSFLESKPCGYIMEEEIKALVNSYDAIVDGEGNPVFETGLVETASLMDVVNNGEDSAYFYPPEIADDLRELGRKTLKVFGVKNRYVHFEFFRLSCDQRIGKKDELIALEVNMRPAGGCSPDMADYANSTDVYKIWADVLSYGSTSLVAGEKYYCGYAGRRKGREYLHSEQSISDKYGKNIICIEKQPEAFSAMMGDLTFLAKFATEEQTREFFADVFM